MTTKQPKQILEDIKRKLEVLNEEHGIRVHDITVNWAMTAEHTNGYVTHLEVGSST